MAKAKVSTVSVNIGISDKARFKVVGVLNQLLADEVLLYIKTRNFHWNVTGPHFFDRHRFFEDQYEQLDEIMDSVAERARALGGRAQGTMGALLKIARLTEATSTASTDTQMLQALLNDHETLIRNLRQDLEIVDDLDDAGTEDFLTGILEDHEKMAWMLRSHLQ